MYGPTEVIRLDTYFIGNLRSIMKINIFFKYLIKFFSRNPLLWIVIAFFIIFCLFIKKYVPSSSSEVASWIQAFGSVMAIFAAIWISDRQETVALDSKRRSILAIVEAVYQRAEIYRSMILNSDFENHLPNSELYNVYDRSVITGITRALSGIPLYEVGSSEGVMALILLNDQFLFLGKEIENFMAGIHNHPDFSKQLEQLAGPENKDLRSKCSKDMFKLLAKNTEIHLNKIKELYLTINTSIKF